MIGSFLDRRAMRGFLFALAIALASVVGTTELHELARALHVAKAQPSEPVLAKAACQVHGDMDEMDETSVSPLSTTVIAEVERVRFGLSETTEPVVHAMPLLFDSSYRAEVFRPPAA